MCAHFLFRSCTVHKNACSHWRFHAPWTHFVNKGNACAIHDGACQVVSLFLRCQKDELLALCFQSNGLAQVLQLLPGVLIARPLQHFLH